MKKTLNIMLSLLILFSFSLHVSSQSSQKDLDQVKLAKQFIGIWVTETGKDSILHAEAIPSGDGIYMHMEWKAKGETYATANSVLGFSQSKDLLVISSVWQRGYIGHDIGKFVSEKKIVMERFFPDQPNHAVAISEVEFTSPDTYIWFMKGRGENITWEPLRTYKWTFTKVKE